MRGPTTLTVTFALIDSPEVVFRSRCPRSPRMKSLSTAPAYIPPPAEHISSSLSAAIRPSCPSRIIFVVAVRGSVPAPESRPCLRLYVCLDG
jgi:hypothetical protein